MEIIQTFFDGILEYVASIPNIVPILFTLILGIALVGWGYSLFRLWLTVVGVWAGYVLGSELAGFLELDGWPYAIVVILITVAMSLFFWLAVKLSIFVAGFFFGVYVVRFFSITLFGLEENVVNLIVGLALAILAVIFLKIFIVSATAISGAYLVADAIHSLIENTDAGSWLGDIAPARDPIPIIMTFLVVTVSVLGIIYQYRRTSSGQGIRLHGQAVR